MHPNMSRFLGSFIDIKDCTGPFNQFAKLCKAKVEYLQETTGEEAHGGPAFLSTVQKEKLYYFNPAAAGVCNECFGDWTYASAQASTAAGAAGDALVPPKSI